MGSSSIIQGDPVVYISDSWPIPGADPPNFRGDQPDVGPALLRGQTRGCASADGGRTSMAPVRTSSRPSAPRFVDALARFLGFRHLYSFPAARPIVILLFVVTLIFFSASSAPRGSRRPTLRFRDPQLMDASLPPAWSEGGSRIPARQPRPGPRFAFTSFRQARIPVGRLRLRCVRRPCSAFARPDCAANNTGASSTSRSCASPTCSLKLPGYPIALSDDAGGCTRSAARHAGRCGAAGAHGLDRPRSIVALLRGTVRGR